MESFPFNHFEPKVKSTLDMKPAAIVSGKAKTSEDQPEMVDSNILLDVDFVEESSFNVMSVFSSLFAGDTLIPDILPNMPGMRITARNKSFVKNFISLCIWKHMNNGDTWVKESDFDLKKNPNNVTEFRFHEKVLKRKYSEEIWKHLTKLGIDQLDTKKLFNFCANTRNLIRIGDWNVDSQRGDGIYVKFHEMLDLIGFKMNNSSRTSHPVMTAV